MKGWENLCANGFLARVYSGLLQGMMLTRGEEASSALVTLGSVVTQMICLLGWVHVCDVQQDVT